ncbi:hypothetical protein EJ03DRAFT_121798 [Teratosphaeria nubilosa]|uniref:Uncharacterized protein n=1 Tax=Teratosphaeria nubilosa TaxID=161662 RepID=A0A6G1L722_9PEZI|nr:hypothetical protein EJ03DRAFT_121798 [Teratosphaeria nubilosa]
MCGCLLVGMSAEVDVGCCCNSGACGGLFRCDVEVGREDAHAFIDLHKGIEEPRLPEGLIGAVTLYTQFDQSRARESREIADLRLTPAFAFRRVPFASQTFRCSACSAIADD